MQKILGAFALAFLLSSCSLIHQMDVEQGNVLTPDMVDELHTGMSEKEVSAILGTPVLLNSFNDNRVEYVYTMKPAGKNTTEKFITLNFKNGSLRSIEGNPTTTYPVN